MHIDFTIKPSNRAKRILTTALAIVLMGAVFFTTLLSLNHSPNRTVRGVTIGPVLVSELEREEAQKAIEKEILQYQDAPIALKAKDGTVVNAKPKEMGVLFDGPKTLNAALSYGKTETWIARPFKQTRALIIGFKHPATVAIDIDNLTNFINNNLSLLHRPAQDASFSYNAETGAFESIPPRDGRILDIPHLKAELYKRAQRFSTEPITVRQIETKPRVTTEGVDEARAQAEKIVAGMPYTIAANDQNWEIEKEDLISWIAFEPSWVQESNQYRLKATINEAAVREYITRFAPGLNEPPVNARFQLQASKVTAFSLAEVGHEIDIEASTQAIKNELEAETKTVKLVFRDVEPKITQESIDSLGINSLIGSGDTNFAGSPKARTHNIHVGADKFQGILIGPQEEFSFDANLGQVGAAEGYLPELVIKQNKTVPEYGGGLCQVSTTLFRAAVYAGLEITERHNHAYPVRYYGTPGFDATIYPPSPDLRFKNNTLGYILLQERIEGTKLIFEIYGKNDRRKVEIDGPHEYDRQANGAVKARLTQRVYSDSGNIMLEKTFYSNYKSPKLYPVIRNPLE